MSTSVAAVNNILLISTNERNGEIITTQPFPKIRKSLTPVCRSSYEMFFKKNIEYNIFLIHGRENEEGKEGIITKVTKNGKSFGSSDQDKKSGKGGRT